MRKRLAIVALVLVVMLVLGELGLRVSKAVKEEAPPHFDRSTELEWQWVLRHLGKDERVEQDAEYHPRLGYVTAPGIDRADTRTNSAGARADREFTTERVPGVPRMVLVGDSYTFGYTVSNEDAWGEVLQRRWLPDWEVINFGVSGYGVDQAVLHYEEIGATYEPDVVVLGFFVRDFFRNLVRFHGYLKPRFALDEGGELVLEDDWIVPPDELLRRYRTGERSIGGWGYSYLLTDCGTQVLRSAERRSIAEDSESVAIALGILRRFRDSVSARGSEPFLLFIPERLDKHLGTYWEEIEHLVLAGARELGLSALSVTDVFEEEERRRPDLPLNPAHLSVRGNEVVAEALFEALVVEGLVESE